MKLTCKCGSTFFHQAVEYDTNIELVPWAAMTITVGSQRYATIVTTICALCGEKMSEARPIESEGAS